jgi:hypothetical protein
MKDLPLAGRFGRSARTFGASQTQDFPESDIADGDGMATGSASGTLLLATVCNALELSIAKPGVALLKSILQRTRNNLPSIHVDRLEQSAGSEEKGVTQLLKYAYRLLWLRNVRMGGR